MTVSEFESSSEAASLSTLKGSSSSISVAILCRNAVA
jgi:hypothetical protein